MALSLILLLVAAVSCANAVSLGRPVYITDYPSVVQVEIRLGDYWIQQCVANVITNYHVLSVASCFSGAYYLPEYRRMRAGTSIRGVGGQLCYVARETNHPNFGLLDYDSDITVVRLESPLFLDNYIAQAPIIGQGIYLPAGLNLKKAGWGTTIQGGQTIDGGLFETDLFVHGELSCAIKYLQADRPRPITENMFCAGLYGRGRDFDSRDMGGPVYYSNALVGITSFGTANANDEYPIVCTAVGSFSDWIVGAAT